MRGGHSRSGPLQKSAAERALTGAKERPRHRTPKSPGTTPVNADACPPPPHLTAAEKVQWRYHAPLLHEAGRLTLEARDVLAKYCTVLATVTRLKRQMAKRTYSDVVIDAAGALRANPVLVQLRQWVMVARAYESDLLLNPASALRAPAAKPDDPAKPVDPLAALQARQIRRVK